MSNYTEATRSVNGVLSEIENGPYGKISHPLLRTFVAVVAEDRADEHS